MWWRNSKKKKKKMNRRERKGRRNGRGKRKEKRRKKKGTAQSRIKQKDRESRTTNEERENLGACLVPFVISHHTHTINLRAPSHLYKFGKGIRSYTMVTSCWSNTKILMCKYKLSYNDLM